MSDLSIIPLEDGFETQLAQDWNGAVGTVYVLDTPGYTPTTTNTYIVVNPGKTNMQIAEITDYDSTANTLTVSNVTLLKGLGINSTAPASSHATGSQVIISDNYQFWVDIQTAINSKLDDTGGTMTGLLQFSGITHAGIKLLSLTTVQRDALSASNGMIIYNSTTGELNQYIGGAWSAVAAGSTQPTASTTVLGKIKTDVTPAGDPVALITDNPKYDALAGTSGTPSTSNKYVTADDVAENTASKVVRRKSDSNITVPTTPTAGTDASSKTYTDTFLNQYLTGNFTQNANVTTTTTIAHGFGKTPKLFRITGVGGGASSIVNSHGAYDGTNNKCVFTWHDTNGSTGGTNKDSTAAVWISYASSSGSGLTTYVKGVVTWDATNVTITWTAGNTNSSLNINYVYEIIA